MRTLTSHGRRTLAGRRSSPGHAGVAMVAGLALLSLAACSSGAAKPALEPQNVVAAAAHKLGTTSGVKLSLHTNALPTGTNGVLDATGTSTRAPAFDGTLKVLVQGAAVTVPVRSVKRTVYAQLPLTTGWSTIKPADYNAFDPAVLINANDGLPAALGQMTAVTAGDQRRGGTDNSEVLTEYHGTIPAKRMQSVIPSAGGDSFTATIAISPADEIREASFTGVFYPNTASMTYTLKVSDYGLTANISAP